MEKSKGTVMATPKGELFWAFVNGKGKLNYDEDGYDFSVDIHLKGQDALNFIAKLTHELGDVAKGFKIKSMGFRPLVEEEQGDGAIKLVTKPFKEIPTGHEHFVFNFHTKVTLNNGKPKIIKILDSKRNIVTLTENIGNGSIGCLSGLVRRWVRKKECGVSLYLNAVQLIKFIPYGGETGFDEQEGGYEYEAPVDEDTGFSDDTESTQAPEKKSFKL